MVIHAALAGQQAERFANGDAHILAGDFNIQPGSAPYRLLTQGGLPSDEPLLPPSREGDSWKASLTRPYVSAYVEALGNEPELTNYALNKFNPEPFMETLDYILAAPGDGAQWKVIGVRPLAGKQAVAARDKSYPSAVEPSDHVLLWSELELQ